MRTSAIGASMLIGVLVAADGAAVACSQPPPDPPRRVWVESTPLPGGRTEVWIGIEVDLFPPVTGGVNCACGIGLGGGALPVPPGLTALSVDFRITNTVTHETEIIPEFALDRNPNVDPTLPGTGVAPGYQAALGGAVWFGFDGVVSPFNIRALGPDEVIKMWFHVEVDTGPGTGGLDGLDVSFASGSVNDPGHPVLQFGNGWTVPAPGSAAMLAFGGIACCARRRGLTPRR